MVKYNDGLNAVQRYYRRNREKILRQKSERYKNNPEVRAKIKLQYDAWRKEHPYEFAMMQKRYKEKKKLQNKISTDENVI